MKIILVVIGAVLGASITWAFIPKVEMTQVIEAPSYLPVPQVDAFCDEWMVTDTSPNYYWDGEGTESQTSTADYWIARTIRDGVQIQSESASQGETITVPPSDDGNITVSWYDSDRTSNHETLNQVVAAVGLGDC